MSARDSLLQTLAVLKDCLVDQAVIDLAPSNVVHNARAQMLRQGLAVLVFSTVETFIRERTGEVLRSFSNPNLAFSDLSPALQKATTLGALEGVRYRLKLQPAASKIQWLMANLAPVSGATSDVRNLSDHSFGYSTSNIDEDDVHDILKSFGVDSPWSQVTSFTPRLGIAILDAKAEFEAIKRRRHLSAHALTGQVLHADLESSVRSSLGICLAFDLLLSHSGGLLNAKSGPGLNGHPLLAHSDVKIVFVGSQIHVAGFSVRNEQLPPVISTPRRVVRRFPVETMAITYGKRYAGSRKRQLVVLDAVGIPVNWFTW